jgi:lipopolysaccharide assembly protein A
MHMIRTIVWVVLLVVLLLFSYNNWNPVAVKIWDGLVLETQIPVLVAASFLLGLVPMWLLSKAGHWRLTRRINALENSMRAAAAPLVATTTKLDEEARLASEDKPG